MPVALVCAGTVLALLALVMIVAFALRPQTFRFRATITRWISLDVEMISPTAVRRDHNPSHQPGGAQQEDPRDMRGIPATQGMAKCDPAAVQRGTTDLDQAGLENHSN